MAAAARISGVKTSWGPSKVKAPSTPSASRRRAWAAASSRPASWVSNRMGPCSHPRGSRRRPTGRTTARSGPRTLTVAGRAGATLSPMAPQTCTPDEAASPDRHHRRRRASASGPANPDAFLTALGQRDDWVDLTFGGRPAPRLLRGAGPSRRVTTGAASSVRPSGCCWPAGPTSSWCPAGFRQFAPILRRYDPRVMTVLAAPPRDGDGQPLAPHRRHLRRAAAGRPGPRPAAGGRGQPQPAPDRSLGPDYTNTIPLDLVDVLVEADGAPFTLPAAAARRHRRGHRRAGPVLRDRRRHPPDRHRRRAQHGGHQARRGPAAAATASTPRCSPTA